MITLQAGSYCATIMPEKGADCVSLRNTKYGAEILRERNPERGFDHPHLYGMPILYPVNRISGGAFTFEGRTYLRSLSRMKREFEIIREIDPIQPLTVGVWSGDGLNNLANPD